MDEQTLRLVHAARAAWYATPAERTAPASPREAEAWLAAIDAPDDDEALRALYGDARWAQIRRGGIVGFYRAHMARARAAAREVQ